MHTDPEVESWCAQRALLCAAAAKTLAPTHLVHNLLHLLLREEGLLVRPHRPGVLAPPDAQPVAVCLLQVCPAARMEIAVKCC